LDLEYQSLLGQVDTLTAKLMALRSSKTKQGNDRASEQAQRLSAEEEDLKIQLLGLRKQLELVKRDREGLTLASPLAGQVDGWEIEQTLLQRPVAQGERLFQIFTPDAGWQVELEIPDQIAGYVAEAQRSGPCPVEFRIRSDPAKSQHAMLSFLSETTQVTAAQKAVVFAKVDLANANIRATRSGARVVARIDCGRSTLGYTWLRETLEFLQRSFWF
jgi:multidrug resistance efflux pump